MATLRSIGLFMPGTPGFFSDVLMGVKEFARGRWAIEVGHSLGIAEAHTHAWRPDGVLICCTDGDWLPLIKRLHTATVLIGGDVLPQYPRILTDDQAIGRMAGRYFLDRGFRHFAYCGYEAPWSNRRETGYREVLSQAGRDCTTFRAIGDQMHVSNIRTLLCDWVRRLPKPVAVFCSHDRIAMFIGHACALIGAAVPDQVAILGVDNNPLECDFTRPPLSSITGFARRLGYEAAQTLEHIMDGKPPPKGPMLVAPSGVEERGSTDVYASDDPDLVAALKFIHTNADQPMRVTDVAKAVIITRRMLERKFLKLMNRSPREEILRAQINRAKQLLIHTDFSALDVALRSGFHSGSRFAEIFKRETGQTPTAFRRHYSAAMVQS